jgi:hypothetical protein
MMAAIQAPAAATIVATNIIRWRRFWRSSCSLIPFQGVFAHWTSWKVKAANETDADLFEPH